MKSKFKKTFLIILLLNITGCFTAFHQPQTLGEYYARQQARQNAANSAIYFGSQLLQYSAPRALVAPPVVQWCQGTFCYSQ